MAEPIVDLKVEVERLKKEVAVVNSINDRIDIAISKLTDVASNIKSMLAVHEEKLSQQEKVDEIIFTKLKDRQEQADHIYQTLKADMDMVEKRLLTEIKALRNDIGGRVGMLEKWKWLILGGAIVIGWTFAKNFPLIVQMMNGS